LKFGDLKFFGAWNLRFGVFRRMKEKNQKEPALIRPEKLEGRDFEE
jgi:hypothetical protein